MEHMLTGVEQLWNKSGNTQGQLCLCAIAVHDPKSNEMVFFVSYTHLFGLSVAVVNINCLAELMTALCRRIGLCPSWHYFDHPGALDFRGGSSDKIGPRILCQHFRPFKPAKHQPAAQRQLHLGLLNVFGRFKDREIALEAREG